MSYTHLLVERDGHVTTVTFNRPARANAMNYAILAEIEHCALAFRDDHETRVVIFTGSGKHFSAGADLRDFPAELAQPLSARRQRFRIGERAMHAILGIDQITIAAWNGGALGGGACLATATDFRVGADDCFMQYPEIDLGMNLMWQSLPLTIRLLGPAPAKRLLIGGERVHAPTLARWGVLDEVVERAELGHRARAFAQTYVDKSPIAAQMIKRSVNQITGALDRALMHMDADQNLLAHASQDSRAAAAAYASKSTAVFTGD
jgi:enoyl-CoA hydratase/carnithine racemase